MSKYATGTTWKSVDVDGTTAYIWLASRFDPTYNVRKQERWCWEVIGSDESVYENGYTSNRSLAREMTCRLLVGDAVFKRTVEHD